MSLRSKLGSLSSPPRCAAGRERSDLAPDAAIDRILAAAADQDDEREDQEEQRHLQPAASPEVADFPVNMESGDGHEADEKRSDGPRQEADDHQDSADELKRTDVIRPEHPRLESRGSHALCRPRNVPAEPSEKLLASVRYVERAVSHAENRPGEPLAPLVQRTEGRKYISRRLLGSLHDASPP